MRTAVAGTPGQRTGLHIPDNLPLALFALAGILGVLKGVVPAIGAGVEFYWLFSYEYGFTRRALIGTLFKPLLRLASFEHLKPVIVAAHLFVCLAIIVVFYILFRRAVAGEDRREVRFTLR